jgi:hypothetical protein
MGVRISIYAVDEPKFAALVDRPLRDLLQFHAANGSRPNESLHFCDVERDLYFHSSPQAGLTFHGGNQPLAEVPVEIFELDSFLDRPAREMLQTDSSLALEIFVDRLSACPSIDCIKEITSGYRRWWIGSLLDAARTAPMVEPDEYRAVETMFRRLLGPYSCGDDLDGIDAAPSRNDFVIVPEDSQGMSVWTLNEVKTLIHFIHSLIEKEAPRFHATRGRIGIAVKTEDEWNEWLHIMLAHLLRLESVEFAQLKVLGFID